MNELAIAIIVLVLGQGALLWYKFGRLEGKVAELCGRIDRSNINGSVKGVKDGR